MHQIFEEKQLKVVKCLLSPAQIVGTEGCWGVIIMGGIVLPIMYIDAVPVLSFLLNLSFKQVLCFWQ
jgi:hypothetical protein